MSIDFNQLSLQVASIAYQAGKFIRQEATNFDYNRIKNKGAHDLVSYVDRESERILVSQLGNLLPEAGFITEEGTAGEANYTEEFTWIIDPLDGTTNFVHGLPCYSVSIALMHKFELVLGIIYDVNLDECFRAVRGGGAYCNEKPIFVSTINELNNSLLGTGFPFSSIDKIDKYISVLTAFMHRTDGVRRLGSAAIVLAYVAAGRLDGYFEFNINSYDVAAGILLVREAGGTVTQFLEGGNPLFNREILATNGQLHEETQSIIKEFWR